MEDVTAGHDIQTYEWREKCGNQTRRRRDFTQQNLQQQHRCVIMSERGEKKRPKLIWVFNTSGKTQRALQQQQQKIGM